MFNLLNTALSLIPPVRVSWIKYRDREENDLGQWISTYEDPIELVGHWQPVPKEKYDQLGLDLNKFYWSLFVSIDVAPVDRDVSGDVILKDGKKFQCESLTDWFGYNGWRVMTCVEVDQ